MDNVRFEGEACFPSGYGLTFATDMNKEFALPVPEDDSDRKLLSDIEQFGWHIIGISADDEGPQYAFTVGLFHTFGHPEILIMGLDNEIACEFLHQLVVSIQGGCTYLDGMIDEDISSLPAAFRSIEFENYKKYIGYGMWFYRSLLAPFPAVQFIWPDQQGIFPWQDGYDERYLKLQKPLYRTN